MRQKQAPALQCSFCHKSQADVRKLISSQYDSPRVYICDACIAVCASILEDQRDMAVLEPLINHPPRTIRTYPTASELLACVKQWITREVSGQDPSNELTQLRAIARQSFVNPDA
jgi:ATP-dependent protease Clp ATPase subunit